MKKSTLLSTLLAATFITSSIVVVNATETTLKKYGRDVVSTGKLGSLSGALFEKDGEWYLQSNNSTYELHIGNHNYRDEIGIDLQKDENVDVTGFVDKEDVSVVTIKIDGKEYRFREDDGRPMWAGRGNGRNRRGNSDGSDRPAWAGRGHGNGGNGGANHTHEDHTHE